MIGYPKILFLFIRLHLSLLNIVIFLTLKFVLGDHPIRRGPSQDVTFFYTGYHLSEQQSCTLIFSTNFILSSYLNSARHHLVIKLCCALNIYFKRSFSKLTHSFVDIELLDLFQNAKFYFYCSRELSVFGLKRYSLRKKDFLFAFRVY